MKAQDIVKRMNHELSQAKQMFDEAIQRGNDMGVCKAFGYLEASMEMSIRDIQQLKGGR